MSETRRQRTLYLAWLWPRGTVTTESFARHRVVKHSGQDSSATMFFHGKVLADEALLIPRHVAARWQLWLATKWQVRQVEFMRG